jgi:hypothetical protein
MAESIYHRMSEQHIRRRHQWDSPQPPILVHQWQQPLHKPMDPQELGVWVAQEVLDPAQEGSTQRQINSAMFP